jgi:hypothetical protein
MTLLNFHCSFVGAVAVVLVALVPVVLQRADRSGAVGMTDALTMFGLVLA